MIITHDPSEYIKGLQQLLISDKKRIGFLFGAGTSLAQKDAESLTVPSIIPLTEEIVQELSESNEAYRVLFEELKTELVDGFNLETILTNLEQKYEIIGTGVLNGLNKEEFQELITSYKESIRDKISIHREFTQNKIPHMVQVDFARWIGQVERKYPIEIFTTNYDYLFELGLEACNVPYYDGFSGSYKPFFNADSIEEMNFLPKQTKLWKVHGSLGWQVEENTGKVIRTCSNENDILIYPSILKYRDSKKQPYESLMDRLSNFLKTDDSILIICGYSFGDEHINARIESALNSNTTSHVIFFYFDDLAEGNALYEFAILNNKVSVYGRKNAIIGGKYGEWKFKNRPDPEDNTGLYFLDEEIEGNIWTGKGEFLLPDFSKLVSFLSSVLPDNEIGEWGRNV